MRMISTLALAVLLVASAANVGGQTSPAPSSPPIAVGPQYDTTHVYVAPEDFDRFVASFVAAERAEARNRVRMKRAFFMDRVSITD